MDWIRISPELLQRFPPAKRYLVGVSGGRDSVALLDCLVEFGYRKLVVCHLNHQLRGQSSKADARFVKKLAGQYGVDFEMTAADVRSLANKKKMSIETAAREMRYSFFAQVAKRRRSHTIFLAHHADDLVETFLLNLFRGAGLTGLAAIREVSKRCVVDLELTIVRPFLRVWRKNIDKYVGEHDLKFCEDASNRNLTPLRNRIRRRVIPYLEGVFGRNIRQNIWRTATIAAEEENWIDSQLPESRGPDVAAAILPPNAALSVTQLRAAPVALQRRAILKWLRAQKVSEVNFDVIERVRSLLDPAASMAKVNAARDQHVRRRAGKIFIE